MQLLDNNSYLKKASMENPRSFIQALTNVAAIGLSLNPAEKLAYLITRNIKNGNQWETRVCLDVSYMGFVRLATDSGSIKWVHADCVYAEDEFIDNGPGEKPTHRYNAFAKSRGEFVGVYCVAKTKDGDYLTEIMPAEDVISIRDRSEAYKAFVEKNKGNGGPWVTDFKEMAKKSVIRRAFKTWPRTNERRMEMLAKAVELSNQNEGFEPILTSPNLGQYTAEQKAYFDQLIEQSNGWGMMVFRKTIEETTFNNLYHSFEKGQKGRYQRIVDELLSKGAEIFRSYTADIEAAVQSGDDAAVLEIIEDMTEAEIDLLRAELSTIACSMIAQTKAA